MIGDKKNIERERLLNIIIYFANHTRKFAKLKLMKLLYYLDFWHFKETGRSVTGLKYKKWEHGPVPPNLYYELKPSEIPEDIESYFFIEEKSYIDYKKLIIKPKKKFNPKLFSKREMRIMERVAEIFKDANSNDMTESSHLRNEPWKNTEDNKYIDYMLALDGQEGAITEDEFNEKQRLDSEANQLINYFYEAG